MFAELEQRALTSTRGRQHLNLHTSYDEPCQRLLNALTLDTYIQPHRHQSNANVECLIALKGRFGCIIFGDEGHPIRKCILGPQEELYGIQIYPRQWHTIISMDHIGTLLEIKSGPFNPDQAKEFAPWAPLEGSPQAAPYLKVLRTLFV